MIKDISDQSIGANGMGETTVREFAAAGYIHSFNHTPPSQANTNKAGDSAFVTIADLNVERGEQVARELAPYAIPHAIPPSRGGTSLTKIRIETPNSSNATSSAGTNKFKSSKQLSPTHQAKAVTLSLQTRALVVPTGIRCGRSTVPPPSTIQRDCYTRNRTC